MMGTRGSEGGGVLEGLIAFGRDPKAMAGRLEQLKAAQDAADERIVKAAEVETANAKRVDELDSLSAELDKRKKALDQRETQVSNGEASLKRRNDAQLQDVDALKGERVAFEEQRRQSKINDAAVRMSIEAKSVDLSGREKAIEADRAALDERDQKIIDREADLAARESAFASRQEALKQALAGV